MVKIKGRNNPKANIFKLLRDWLRDRKRERWLIILNNADDAGYLIERSGANQEPTSSSGMGETLFGYLPPCDHGSILITTRSEEVALRLVDHPNMIAVKTMSENDGLALLDKELGQQMDKGEGVELAAALEHMPLAITQAAAYIKRMSRRCSVL